MQSPIIILDLFRCPSCKTARVSMAPFACGQCHQQFSIQNNVYHFVPDQNTETWDHYWKRIPVYDTVLDMLRKIMNIQLRRYLTKHLQTGESTLEPGGGSAYVSAMLAEKGYASYAMDYASMPLTMAQQQGSKAILIQGDIFNMPFVDESFDLTFNNSTLEHFPNPLDALREMVRVTKRGKHVFVGVPYTYGPLSVYKLKKSSFKGAWDGTTYSGKSLKKLFQEAGLEVVGSRTFFFRCFIGVMGRKKS